MLGVNLGTCGIVDGFQVLDGMHAAQRSNHLDVFLCGEGTQCVQMTRGM